jgi:peptidylprolyl isomerase
MRKLETLTRCSAALALALLGPACFTPAGFGAGVAAEEHGEGEHADDVKKAEAALPEEPAIVEGIIPDTQGVKLDVKMPEIAYEPPFDGKPLDQKTLENGMVIEDFVLGDGEVVADGMVVAFEFKGYATASGQTVMGSRGAPSKLMVNEATRSQDPIAKALLEGLAGMKPGGKRRIKIPSEIVEEGAPEGRPAIGDLMMAVNLISVAPVPVLHGVEKYSGDPISTKKRSNGLEIYDYVAGEGPSAKAGDTVVAHYIGQLTDGSEFDSSHSRADGLTAVVGGPGVIAGFSQGIEGAKAGMLRKIVIPPELGYGEVDKGKIPPNSTLVFFLQITSVTPGSGAQQDMIVPRNGAERPAGEGDKPPKPKTPKPPEGGN